MRGLGFQRSLVAHAVIGGLASVAGGGQFANGAITAAFGYLFNEIRVTGTRDGAAVDQALSYLMRDPSMAGLIRFAGPDAPLDVTIRTHDGLKLPQYDPDTRTIDWNPRRAAVFPNGDSASPALILGHELGHPELDKSALMAGVKTPWGKWFNYEEYRVIRDYEHPRRGRLVKASVCSTVACAFST